MTKAIFARGSEGSCRQSCDKMGLTLSNRAFQDEVHESLLRWLEALINQQNKHQNKSEPSNIIKTTVWTFRKVCVLHSMSIGSNSAFWRQTKTDLEVMILQFPHLNFNKHRLEHKQFKISKTSC